MKCKKCKRTIEDNSIYCNWCGYKQIADSTELRVPKPTRREDGTWTARIMVAGERVVQVIKNLAAMREAWIRSLDWEDPLEEGMATHSSVLPMGQRIPWTEEPGGLQSMGSLRVRHD